MFTVTMAALPFPGILVSREASSFLDELVAGFPVYEPRSDRKMSGAPRQFTELSQLTDDITKSLVDSIERHTIGLQKRRRHHAHDTLNSIQIRALRDLLGLNQGQLATQVGSTRSVVVAWENNYRNPNRKFTQRLRTLARLNKIDVEKLEEEDYVKESLKARVTMEPMKVVLEKLERVVTETTQL